MSGLGFGNIFSRNQQPLETSGDVELKRNVNKKTFETNVTKALDDNLLTKAEYKTLKDSISGGRTEINRVIASAGVATEEQLSDIFKRGNNSGSISMSPIQKEELKNMLLTSTVQNGNVQANQQVAPLTNTEQRICDSIKNKLSKDRTNLSEDMIKDFIFSPEISGSFKEFCIKDYSVENMNYLLDVKKVMENPTHENLNKLANDYQLTHQYNNGNVNVGSSSYNECRAVFPNKNNNNSNGTIQQKLTAIENTLPEVLSNLNNVFSRFDRDDNRNGIINGVSKGIFIEASTKRNPTDYISSVIDANSNNKIKVELAEKALTGRLVNGNLVSMTNAFEG